MDDAVPGCEACGGTKWSGLATWHKRCLTCGLEMSTLTAHIDDRDGPDIDEDARELALRPIRDGNFNALLTWLRAQPRFREVSEPLPTLLDVGCAHGWFLEKASANFDALGIEPDLEVARRTLGRGLPVRRGFFPDALRADETFDVIVFNDVLEHIPGIVGSLLQCETRLRPGGVVVVNAPDRRGVFYGIASFLSRIGLTGPFDRMWQKDLPSPHLYYFDSTSLSTAARGAGLEITASRRLPTVTARGLYSRIRCSGDVPRWKALLLAAGILPVIPALGLLPSDITVWILARKA